MHVGCAVGTPVAIRACLSPLGVPMRWWGCNFAVLLMLITVLPGAPALYVTIELK